MTENPWEEVEKSIGKGEPCNFMIGEGAILHPDGCKVTISAVNGDTRNVERKGLHRIWTAFRVRVDQLEPVRE